MRLKTSYSLIVKCKLFSIEEDDVDLKGCFSDSNARQNQTLLGYGIVNSLS